MPVPGSATSPTIIPDPTGLLYRRNRYYDPTSGVWTQPDPIGLAGGLNLYGFAGGDPISYTDPFGLNPCLVPPVAAYCWTLITAAAGALVAATPGFVETTGAAGEFILDNARTTL